MSSSNRVRIALIEETTYGETPAAGNFMDARYTSESLSGTPNTTESQTIRSDRQSSGQIVTGLEVGGDLSMELAKDPVIDELMESAMLSPWDVQAPSTRDFEIAATTKKIISTTGSFVTDGFVKGDFVKLSGFVETANNTLAAIKSVSALEMELITEFDLEDETIVSATVTRCDKAEIGTTQKSFSMEKNFLDLTSKAINYRGMLVASMSIQGAYGSPMTASFGFSGNDYQAVDQAADMMTNTRTVTGQATTPFLNGSLDMPIIASSATSGTLSSGDMCLQSIGLELDNNLAELTCIGKAAPEGYDPGTARISVSLSTYLKDSSWVFLPKKLNQEPFELLFAVENSGGGYGFYLPAIQVSSDDPASGGLDQQVSLELEGQAKVGANGESALSIYKI